MALSLREHDRFGADALSAATVGNALVDRVYAKLTPVYDLVFGPTLQPGRVKAIARMELKPGDRVLEVGAGTGHQRPAVSRATARSLRSTSRRPMLEKARERIALHGLRNVRLLEADAAHLTFADDSFDCVYAPYTISVVPDPVKVAVEMKRVCRPGGRIVILNHFRSDRPADVANRARHLAGRPCTSGSKPTWPCRRFSRRQSLRPLSVEKVNFPPILVLHHLYKDRNHELT